MLRASPWCSAKLQAHNSGEKSPGADKTVQDISGISPRSKLAAARYQSTGRAAVLRIVLRAGSGPFRFSFDSLDHRALSSNSAKPPWQRPTIIPSVPPPTAACWPDGKVFGLPWEVTCHGPKALSAHFTCARSHLKRKQIKRVSRAFTKFWSRISKSWALKCV